MARTDNDLGDEKELTQSSYQPISAAQAQSSKGNAATAEDKTLKADQETGDDMRNRASKDAATSQHTEDLQTLRQSASDGSEPNLEGDLKTIDTINTEYGAPEPDPLDEVRSNDELLGQGGAAQQHANRENQASTPEGSGRADGSNVEMAREFKVYKRRWFGLVQLVLLNIIVSWDVSDSLGCLQPWISRQCANTYTYPVALLLCKFDHSCTVL
jgi:hypothetical protein